MLKPCFQHVAQYKNIYGKNILGKVDFNHAFYTLCGMGRLLNKVWTNYQNQNLTFWVNRVPIKKLWSYISHTRYTLWVLNIPYFQSHCKTITHLLGTWSKCKPQIHTSQVKVKKKMVNLKKGVYLPTYSYPIYQS